MWKLVKDLGMRFPTAKSKQKKRYGLYECSGCGEEFEVATSNVKSGRSTHCKNCGMKTHGLQHHPLYHTWNGMKDRCNNPNHSRHESYGGRGISVSDEFLDFATWLVYVESLENYSRDGYSLDRKDNDVGYQRGNLRWASRVTQARNTRKLMSTNTSGYRGAYKKGDRWAAQITVDSKTIHLGTFDTPKEAALAYDAYVIENKLEHTMNFKRK